MVAGAAMAMVAIAFVNLMHFSQGWVQFGYRFSNDFAPFALILVALALARLAGCAGRSAVARGGVRARQRVGRLLGRGTGW